MKEGGPLGDLSVLDSNLKTFFSPHLNSVAVLCNGHVNELTLPNF